MRARRPFKPTPNRRKDDIRTGRDLLRFLERAPVGPVVPDGSALWMRRIRLGVTQRDLAIVSRIPEARISAIELNGVKKYSTSLYLLHNALTRIQKTRSLEAGQA